MADIDSILTSTKKLLGIASEYTAYDLDIILHINSVFSTLTQLGVGPTDDQLYITGANTTWDELLGDQKNLGMVKSYMFLRVKLMFDPPPTGFALTSMGNQIKELEWRMMVSASSTPNLPGTVVTPVAGPVAGKKSIWDLTGLDDFPDEAPIDAVGIDLITGIIWRKDS